MLELWKERPYHKQMSSNKRSWSNQISLWGIHKSFKGENQTPKSKVQSNNSPGRSENNRRVIDGKAMFWPHKYKKWVDDKKTPEVSFAQPNQQTQGAAGLTTAPTTVVQQQEIATDDQIKSAREADLSNASHAINLALRNLINVFSEWLVGHSLKSKTLYKPIVIGTFALMNWFYSMI